MMNIKKIIAGALAAFMFSTVAYVPVIAEDTSSEEGNAAFDELLLQDFKDSVSSDYLTMHFLVKDLDSYDLEKPEVTIGKGPSEEYEDAVEEAEKMIAKLQEFDYDSLSSKQQHDYDAVMYAYEDQLNRSQYWQYQWVFSPSNNVIQNISTNLTEFVFYENQDFYDYVTLLSTVSDYLQECIEFTEKQVTEGYFMSDAALEESLDAIGDYLEQTDTNPIIVDFENDADASSYLSDGEKVDLKTQVRDIVVNDILPKCTEVYEYLEGKEGTTGNVSFYDMEDGLDYYTLNVQNIASTSKTIQEQFDELDSFLQDAIDEYIEILTKNNSYTEGSVALTDAESVLSYLSSHFTEYGFPEIPDVNYTAEYLDPTVVSGNVLAYYMSSPIDDYTENSIKINGDNISDSNTLYMTLAHEGYPGHLYQHVYYLSTDPSPLRVLCSFLGYTEGWAMYAEVHAMSWNVLSETNARVEVLDTELNYGLCALIDLGVNGLGWDEEDVADYLDSMGLNSSIADIFYEQTLIYPGDYNSYGYGLIRLMALEQEAKEALGSEFDLESFNKVILDDGPRTLDAVEKDVKSYISSITGVSSNTDTPTTVIENTPTSSQPNYILYIGAGVVVILVVIIIVSRGQKGSRHGA